MTLHWGPSSVTAAEDGLKEPPAQHKLECSVAGKVENWSYVIIIIALWHCHCHVMLQLRFYSGFSYSCSDLPSIYNYMCICSMTFIFYYFMIQPSWKFIVQALFPNIDPKLNLLPFFASPLWKLWSDLANWVSWGDHDHEICHFKKIQIPAWQIDKNESYNQNHNKDCNIIGNTHSCCYFWNEARSDNIANEAGNAEKLLHIINCNYTFNKV